MKIKWVKDLKRLFLQKATLPPSVRKACGCAAFLTDFC